MYITTLLGTCWKQMSGSAAGKLPASRHGAVSDSPMRAPLILGLVTSLPLVMAAGVLVWVGHCGPAAHAQSTALDSPAITGFEDDTGIQGDRTTSDNLPTLFGTAGADLKVQVHRGNSVLGTRTPMLTAPGALPSSTLCLMACTVSPQRLPTTMAMSATAPTPLP